VAKAAAELVLQGKVSEVYFTLGEIDNSGVGVAQKMAWAMQEHLHKARKEGRSIPDFTLHVLKTATTTISELRTLRKETQKNGTLENGGVILLGIAPHVRGVGEQEEGRIQREARRMFGQAAIKNGSVQIMTAEDVLRDAGRYGDIFLELYDVGHEAMVQREEFLNRIDAIPFLGGFALEAAAKVLDGVNRMRGSKDKAVANRFFTRRRARLERQREAREQDLINTLKAA